MEDFLLILYWVIADLKILQESIGLLLNEADFFSPAKFTREGNGGGVSLADMHSPSLTDTEESAKSAILEPAHLILVLSTIH